MGYRCDQLQKYFEIFSNLITELNDWVHEYNEQKAFTISPENHDPFKRNYGS